MRSYIKRSRMKNREGVMGYVFIAPWIIGFLLFTVLPMIVSLIMSFNGWDPFAKSIFKGFQGFVGFQNYTKVITNMNFKISIFNTLIYTLFATLIAIAGGIIVGYSLLKNKWHNKILRTIIYLPCLVIGIAFSMMMAPVFDATEFSLINQLILTLGGKSQSWLNTRYQAVWIMVIMAFWGLGSSMIVFIAGFKNVDSSLVEASKIDGASDLQILFRISIPLITYVIIYQAIMGIIYGMQIFDIPMGLASATNNADKGMGMNNALGTLVYFLYRKGFMELEMAQAAAAGWIIFALSAGFSILLLVFVKLTKYYSVD